MKDSVQNLNTQQKLVVKHKAGPLLVVAGAGTGKTHVIVEKINKLLSSGVPASQILAVTFTEKAAAEMLDRVLASHKQYELQLPVMTFNALGESILREFSADLGLGRDFRLLNENAQIVFLRQRLDSLKLDYFAPVSSPDSMLGDLTNYFSKLKQQTITPETYLNAVKKLPSTTAAEKAEKAKHHELANAYHAYIQLCRDQNVIDYDDQIYLVLELVKKRPNVAVVLAERFHTILVDEFQDTNLMQSKLIDHLAGAAKSLVVVGDDDQSIYGFRGATLANILQFKERYTKSKQITLITNYRSTQNILDAAYRLIQNNPDRLENKLKLNKKLLGQTKGKPPQVNRFSDLNEELYWIASDIRKRLQSGQKPGSIAVLTRRSVTAELISEALEHARVDHVVVGRRYSLYQTPVVRMLIELSRTLSDPFNNLSLYHTLTSDLFDVPTATLSALLAKQRREQGSLEAAIKESEAPEHAQAKEAVKQLDVWRDEASIFSIRWLLNKFITDTGYKQKLYQAARDEPERQQAVSHLGEFFNSVLKDFESIAAQPTVLQFIEALPALQAAGERGMDDTLDLSSEKVNVLTIHKAKGLEWDTVYIPDCTESSFPLKAMSRGITLPATLTKNEQADDHYAEERRLMYVAITRAKNNLTLTFSDQHGNGKKRRVSRFISEIFGNDILGLTELPADELIAVAEAFTTPSMSFEAVQIPKSMYDGKTVSLSVSQVVTFLNCPLDFYFRYILKVPEEPSPNRDYGSRLHAAIESINRGLLAGKMPDLKQLEGDMLSTWPKVGYLSAQQRDRSISQAKKTLRSFYGKSAKVGVAPKLIEEPFKIKIPELGLVLSGKYDAVFETPEGIEIRDYKTSTRVDTPEAAKTRARSSDQLTLYALAWQISNGALPSGLSLEFVDNQLLTSVKKTAKGIDGMVTKLEKAVEAIREGKFKASNGKHDRCAHPM